MYTKQVGNSLQDKPNVNAVSKNIKLSVFCTKLWKGSVNKYDIINIYSNRKNITISIPDRINNSSIEYLVLREKKQYGVVYNTLSKGTILYRTNIHSQT